MKKYFLTGLITLLPLAITVWVVRFFVRLLTGPFIGIVSVFTNQLPLSQRLIHTLSRIFILIGLVVFTFFLGLVARKFFFSQMIRLGDKLLIKIPLINKVYKTSKDLVVSLFGSKERSFKQVVLLPFPYKGSFCLGLVAKKSPETCSKANQEELLSVFIPTTPNPSTGFLIMSKASDLIYLEMKTEEAIKYIVSCAVIQPEVK